MKQIRWQQHMKAKNNKLGFTLIEMVIVMTVIAVLSAGISGFIMSAMDTWVFVKARESALASGRGAIERVVREIRRIKQPNTITTAEASECGFLDIDSAIVDFKQEGTNLMRNNDILATGLYSPNGLVFYYYDSNMAITTIKQDMRYIKVHISLFKGTQGVTLEDGARIRNT
ncbi:MAG: MSHA bioproteinis protein MshO [Candidatus Saganbacteria bacterium]|uniref:MSHA bioproteinis protein MshO n=1 Tax=Candidatus Saganbacteria bacterium TaxID=2575572 RepID=A0A833L151_UNCSA|nr:MAG: MSHA bioproteinis protein MshO [Candidatus Saganbacteria bacterium]